MLRNIHLHGVLAEQFQPRYELDVETPGEALRALMTQVRGFESVIREGEFTCIRGDFDTGVECDESLLQLRFGSVRDFHIVPAVAGAGRGVGKILVGVALIGATLLSGGAALAAVGGLSGAFGAGGVGLSGVAGAAFGGGIVGAITGGFSLGAVALGVGGLLVLSGAASMLSMMPKMSDDLASTDSKAGFLFNGAINTSVQGGPIPLVFGRIDAGSVVVSVGFSSERLDVAVPGAAGPASSGTISYPLNLS